MKNTKNTFQTMYSISVAWQLGFFIVVPIAGFIFLGYYFDKKFGTTPYLLLLGLFAGIVITVYEVFHLLEPLLNKDNDKPNAKH